MKFNRTDKRNEKKKKFVEREKVKFLQNAIVSDSRAGWSYNNGGKRENRYLIEILKAI